MSIPPDPVETRGTFGATGATGVHADPPGAMGIETILQEAQRIVYGAREVGYGHPRDNMDRIARIWSVILSTDITPRQVALCMVGVKLAREVKTEARDNLVDIAGYAAVADRVAEPH